MTWKQELLNTKRGCFEVFRKGSGEPLCVTHHYSAFNASGDHFADAFTETHEVFLVNMREAGHSERAHEPYQLGFLETVFDLEAVREALGFDSWTFAGHSTGGMIGTVYGIYFSKSLNSLVIVGSAAREFISGSAQCIYHEDHPDYVRMQELNITLKGSSLPEDERKALTRERISFSLYKPERFPSLFPPHVTKRISATRMDFFNREIQLFDVTRKLHLIDTPTLIVCGRHDVQCPLLYSEEMREGIPGAELVVFDESNHYPFLEEKERFRTVSERFFGKVQRVSEA